MKVSDMCATIYSILTVSNFSAVALVSIAATRAHDAVTDVLTPSTESVTPCLTTAVFCIGREVFCHLVSLEAEPVFSFGTNLHCGGVVAFSFIFALAWVTRHFWGNNAGGVWLRKASKTWRETLTGSEIHAPPRKGTFARDLRSKNKLCQNSRSR